MIYDIANYMYFELPIFFKALILNQPYRLLCLTISGCQVIPRENRFSSLHAFLQRVLTSLIGRIKCSFQIFGKLFTRNGKFLQPPTFHIWLASLDICQITMSQVLVLLQRCKFLLYNLKCRYSRVIYIVKRFLPTRYSVFNPTLGEFEAPIQHTNTPVMIVKHVVAKGCEG